LGPKGFVHNTADIAHTSPTFRVEGSTLAATFFLFSHDAFHDGGPVVSLHIPYDVVNRVIKTKTDLL
jgi:hypothetical protein